MKNAAYFYQTKGAKRFKHKQIKPKQLNLFYLQVLKADFNLLNRKQQVRFVGDINRLFGDSEYMLRTFADKLNLRVRWQDSVEGVRLII